MAELLACRIALKLAWALFAPKAASELEKQRGDPAIEKIRTYLLSEFQKIHEQLNALRRKELAAAVNYLENGYSVLNSDVATAIGEFKKARDTSHIAFGIVPDVADKLLATKIAVIATFHEFGGNAETCQTLCLKYLSRLNLMPEVIKACQMMFERSAGGRLLSLTGKATRREVLEGTALINKVAWDYFIKNDIAVDGCWPLIKLESKSIHPIYDLVILRPPRILFTLVDSFDGIVAAAVHNRKVYVSGSSQVQTNAVAVIDLYCEGIKYLLGHSGMVLCLEVVDKFLFSGSFDKTIMVWDILSLECKAILTQHSGSVRCMCKNQLYLYSGSTDSKIIAWNTDTLTVAQVIDTNAPVVSIKCSRRKFLYCLTGLFAIQLWLVSEDSHTCMRDLKVPSTTSKFFFVENSLLACAKDKFQVWNLGSMKVENTVPITCRDVYVMEPRKYVIVLSGNNELLLFDVKTGKIIGQEITTGSSAANNFEVLTSHEGELFGFCKSSRRGEYNLIVW